MKKIKQIIKSKVFKNSIWLTILQLVNTVIPMLTIPYITRVLGAAQYGIFSVALNWIIYFQVIVEFGFNLTGSKKIATAKNDQEVQTIFNNIISARIILFIFTFVLLNIVTFLAHFSLQIYICMILLCTMVLGTAFQITWLFQGKQDMKFITIINSTARIISVILIFLFVKSTSDVYIYAILYSITLLLSSIISLIIAKKKYNLIFKFTNLKSIKNELNDGKYLFYSSAMTKIFSGFGTTILGFISSANIVGIYSAIYKIPYILTMFFSPISQAIYPNISIKFKKDNKEAFSYIKMICKPILCIFIIISIIIIIFKTFFVNILFGKEYVKYSVIVIPLVMQFIFGMINNFLGVQILIASNHQKEYTKAFTIGCLATVLSNCILGFIYGIYGVAISAFLGEFILTLLLIKKIIKIFRRNHDEKN